MTYDIYSSSSKCPSEIQEIEDIQGHGLRIIHVADEEDQAGSTYSIAIDKSKTHPQIIIIGLNIDMLVWIVKEYNRYMKVIEPLEPDELYKCFSNVFNGSIKHIKKQFYEEYIGWGIWL